MSLGKRIRTVREARGKSQSYVAEATGLSQAYISSLESGSKINPTQKTLTDIARSLEVEPELLTDDGAAFPQELIDLPLDIVAWLSDKKNIDYIIQVKDAQEKGFEPEEIAKILELYRGIMKGNS